MNTTTDNAQGLMTILSDMRECQRAYATQHASGSFRRLADRLEAALATHPPQQDNTTPVDRGALQMAVNVLRRAGKDEVADALLAAAPAAPSSGHEAALPATPDIPHDALDVYDDCRCRACAEKRGQPVATPESAEPVAGPAYWLAVDVDSGAVEMGMSTDDTNEGEFARSEVNQFINDHGACMRLIGVYTQPATALDSSVPMPAGLDKCPITGLPFFENIEHPDLGMVPTYGGPFDSYTIPAQEEDGELRRERYDHDRDEWIEGGEHFASIANETGTHPTPAASDGGLREAIIHAAAACVSHLDYEPCNPELATDLRGLRKALEAAGLRYPQASTPAAVAPEPESTCPNCDVDRAQAERENKYGSDACPHCAWSFAGNPAVAPEQVTDDEAAAMLDAPAEGWRANAYLAEGVKHDEAVEVAKQMGNALLALRAAQQKGGGQ